MDLAPQAQVGKLTLIAKTKVKGVFHWECLCRCGNTKIIRQDHLRSGAVKSCGCRKSQVHAIAMKAALKGGL